MTETVREQVLDEMRDLQVKTVNICIEALESLHADKQGLPLDDTTISACARMLRNLRDGPARPSGGDE